jgi:hypothetical protein
MDPVQRWTPAQARMHPFITGEKWTKPWRVCENCKFSLSRYSYTLFSHRQLLLLFSSSQHRRPVRRRWTPKGRMVVWFRHRQRVSAPTRMQRHTISSLRSIRHTLPRPQQTRPPRAKFFATLISRIRLRHNRHHRLSLPTRRRRSRRLRMCRRPRTRRRSSSISRSSRSKQIVTSEVFSTRPRQARLESLRLGYLSMPAIRQHQAAVWA